MDRKKKKKQKQIWRERTTVYSHVAYAALNDNNPFNKCTSFQIEIQKFPFRIGAHDYHYFIIIIVEHVEKLSENCSDDGGLHRIRSGGGKFV